jgi:5-hydroxyisourate hydrolase
MPGLSIHVVDVARGSVARGMQVEVHATAPRRLIAAGAINANGVLDAPALAAVFAPGYYEVVFHVAAFYCGAGVGSAELPEVPFLDQVTYRFGVADSQQHYHLPMKLTPWGFSCFRGGA